MNMWDKVWQECRDEIEKKLQSAVDEESGEACDKVFLVAIDGMCGSGKSTAAEKLQEYFGCSLFHMDDFFLQPHQRTEERLAQPGGNVDYERFQTEVLEHLTDQEGLWFQRFDCGSFALKPREYVTYNRMVIVEGVYSCHPYFGAVQDVRIFLESDREGQRQRILERSGAEKLKMFEERWIPMEERYFEAYKIKQKCKCIKVETTH